MKEKSTKSALLTSAMALLLCFSMLLGTTFAWFTDTASTGVNKIQAGNLQITAEYNVLNSNGTLGTTWNTIENSDSLFNKNALWEPGHTEYAVIRIKNDGNLALKYQVKLDIVSETGSINVNGSQFKLSDYLKYGVMFDTAVPSVNRSSAVAMATTGLAAYSSENRNLSVGSGYDYMVLAITMPTDVGNDANYDKQYNAPSIGLGITVLATQQANESDSFGNDYDSGAQYDAPTFTTTSNVIFPVKARAALADGKYTANLTATTTMGTTVNIGSVVVPSGRVADDTKPVEVEVKPAARGNFSAAAAGTEVKYYDISVSNLNTGTDEVTVTLKLDKGLTNVVIKHDKGGTVGVVEIRNVNYNPTTGEATFETDSFSPFAVEYKAENVAKIGDVYYSSLADAVAAAGNGATITLLKNVQNAEGMTVASGKTFTIDFNGFTYELNKPGAGSTGTETNGFQLLKGSTIVMKNGTITISEENLTPATTGKNIKRIIQNYSKLTLQDMTIDGTNQYGDADLVMSFNNDPVLITGNTNIIAAEGKRAFDADGNWGGYNRSEVTIDTTGTIVGNIELGSGKLIIKNANVKGGVVSSSEDTAGRISITGGTFSTNPSAYLANGYNVNEENGRYVVYAGTIVCTAAELQTILTAYTASGAGDNVVSIANDLRLAEGEQWVPATVHGYTGAGVITVNGNGHTIYGLNAPLFAGGFAGNSGIIVNDLTIDGASIDDTHADQGLGAFICSIDSMPTITLTNCHLKNSTITSTGDVRVGGLIGWSAGYNNPNDGPVDTYITVTGCSVVNCQITAAGSVGAIIGHAGNNPATYHTISNNTVKNCTLNSTDDGGWRVGVVVGTANVGEVTISNTTESGNTLTQTGKTAPDHSNLYGRFVPETTGKLTIDGNKLTA